MLTLIRTTWNTYRNHFILFLKIISPFLIPIILIRATGQYSYLGYLSLIFTVLFGVVFFVINFFVTIMLISSTHQILSVKQNLKVPTFTPLLKEACKKFPRYIGLFIIQGLIIGILPFFLYPVHRYFISSPLGSLIQFISYAWIFVFALTFLFSFYALIIEHKSIVQSLKRGFEIFSSNPLNITLSLILGFLLFSGIFIFFAVVTNTAIAFLSHQQYIFLGKYTSPWWQDVVIVAYTFLNLPILIILTTQLYIRNKDKRIYGSGPRHRLRNPRPA